MIKEIFIFILRRNFHTKQLKYNSIGHQTSGLKLTETTYRSFNSGPWQLCQPKYFDTISASDEGHMSLITVVN